MRLVRGNSGVDVVSTYMHSFESRENLCSNSVIKVNDCNGLGLIVKFRQCKMVQRLSRKEESLLTPKLVFCYRMYVSICMKTTCCFKAKQSLFLS